MTAPIYALSYIDIDGHPQALSQFSGRLMLLVNVASACGFTQQYEGLEALHRRLEPRGLIIIGFPCNQFGGQEPGSEAEIKTFCQSRFGVTFRLARKIEVRGPNTHPIFAYLTEALPGALGTRAIKWNFTKFLIGPAGQPLARFGPKTTPKEFTDQIEAALPKV